VGRQGGDREISAAYGFCIWGQRLWGTIKLPVGQSPWLYCCCLV